MTILELAPRPVAAKSPRPTVTTPVLPAATAEPHIAAIDEDLDCLYCVAGTLAGTDSVPDEAVNALKTLHARMKRNVDALYTLG
jgi:hypothetical protein